MRQLTAVRFGTTKLSVTSTVVLLTTAPAAKPVPGDGGAIWNSGTAAAIGDINGSFINNSASQSGGALWNNETKIGILNGGFISNTAAYDGGAILEYTFTLSATLPARLNKMRQDRRRCNLEQRNRKESSIGSITGDFRNNSAETTAALIWNVKQASVGDINGNFINNQAKSQRRRRLERKRCSCRQHQRQLCQQSGCPRRRNI